MRNLVRFFIRYPIYANAIIIITAIAGMLSLFMMKKSFFPEMTPNKVYVNVAYPGASPKEIEEGITTRIEESLNGIEGIKEITSSSYENTSSVIIEIYARADIDEVLQDVKSSVDAIYSFPNGAEKPIVYKQKSRGMGGMGNVVGFYSISGTNDLWKLKEISDKVEKDLLNERTISQIEVIGYAPIIISIEIKEEELIKHNLTFDIVSNAIRTSNIDISAGSIKTNKDEIIIRSNNKSSDAENIRETIVYSSSNGDIIRLKEIADVEVKFSDIPFLSYVNGKRSINFIIEKTTDEDIKKIAQTVEKYMRKFNSENEDFKMTKLFQFSDLLDERINTLSWNLIIGLLLVLIVLGLFLSLRLSLWVAFGIPFSFIGMISIGLIYGMTINMISLFGMILVVGILVDDGIVIAENIYSHFEKGKSPARAALDGTMEVIKPVLTSVLTTVFAFSTLLFVGGEMEMMQEMAFSVVACLLFSLIEAFLILPAHLSSKKALSSKKSTRRKRLTWAFLASLITGIITHSVSRDLIPFISIEIHPMFRIINPSIVFIIVLSWERIKSNVEGLVEYSRDLYTRINTRFVRSYKWHVWSPLLFIFIVILLLMRNDIKTTFFPNVPFNDVMIEFAYKPGEREYRTENFLWYCDSIVRQYDKELEQKYGESLITQTSLTIGFTENLGERGAHAGSIRVSVKENKHISTVEISNEIQKRIPEDSLAKLEKISIGGPQAFGEAIAISLQSEDSEELSKAVDWLKLRIKSIDEVKEIVDNGGVGNKELHLKLKDKAYNLGLNEAIITRQIRQGFFGEEVQRLIIGRDEVKIWLKYPLEDRNNINDLDRVLIKTENGSRYPLNELADYEYKRGRVRINHINGAKATKITGSLYNSERSSEVNSEIEKKFLSQLEKLFPNVSYRIMGQAEQAAESGKQLGIAFLISVILIIITISLNFKSFYQARLILMVIPVGVFSAILGHGIISWIPGFEVFGNQVFGTERPFSMLSLWGVVALIGILVNDAVVMLDKYNNNLKEGMNVEEAAIKAGRSRFRAIILTTITTFVGLFPLILETSFQTQFLVPMAISVAFGVLFGTIILLFYFPCLILYFNDLRRTRWWIGSLGSSEVPSKIEVEPITKILKRENELIDKR